ncbi:MAG: HNH endonuclease signature motif containing protein [Gordonibacter sp.]
MFRTVEEFRKSKTWQRFILALKLERLGDGGANICAHCGKPIIAKYDCIGHHTIEVTQDNVNDATVTLNPDNVKLVHHRCHNKIHDRWQGGNPYSKHGREVYVVWGSPCSGKASWVEDNAAPEDLVVDVDKLFAAICTAGIYNKPNGLLPSAMVVRNALLDHIKVRAGKWQRAWVIGGYPLLMERVRLTQSLGAESLFIECPKSLCLERAVQRSVIWSKAIEQWWDSYQPDPPGSSGDGF